tara:strand:+ start:607 stop:807 length:201 start_codon:yes stop_codon:yes gene_type:complete
MAYKNASDNKYNASMANMMSKVKNPNFSIDKKGKKKKGSDITKKEEEEEEKEMQRRLEARNFKPER